MKAKMKLMMKAMHGVAAVVLATGLVMTAVPAGAQTSTNGSAGIAPSLGGGILEVLQSLGLSTSPTNYAVVPFYGRSTTGHDNAAGLLLVENVNNNVGIVGGFDSLWGGAKSGANIVGGGLSLRLPTHPLAFIGTNAFFQNLAVTPYAVSLVGTPVNGTSNNGGLAGINRVGASVDLYNLKGWEIGAGADYGNRTGAGEYSRNYIDFILNIRKGF